ncbi:hypothetical protein Tco_0907265 [Tanacetum coccineum]|uniref:Uncharacterized protein n=1 Tax=Tanacetum coccineum TaxID=301880 RepID=A0ABQ5CJ42_9ASTR
MTTCNKAQANTSRTKRSKALDYQFLDTKFLRDERAPAYSSLSFLLAYLALCLSDSFLFSSFSKWKTLEFAYANELDLLDSINKWDSGYEKSVQTNPMLGQALPAIIAEGKKGRKRKRNGAACGMKTFSHFFRFNNRNKEPIKFTPMKKDLKASRIGLYGMSLLAARAFPINQSPILGTSVLDLVLFINLRRMRHCIIFSYKGGDRGDPDFRTLLYGGKSLTYQECLGEARKNGLDQEAKLYTTLSIGFPSFALYESARNQLIHEPFILFHSRAISFLSVGLCHPLEQVREPRVNELKEPHDWIVHRLCIWMCIKRGRGRGREREEAARAPHEHLTGALMLQISLTLQAALLSIFCRLSDYSADLRGFQSPGTTCLFSAAITVSFPGSDYSIISAV